MRRALPLACAALLGIVPEAAEAVSCTVSTQPANFGVYDPLASTPGVTTGAVDVACTCSGLDCVAFNYRIEIAAGQSGTTAAREMRSGAGRLKYNLYTDAGFTTVWGTGSAGYSVLYLIGLFGSRQSTVVYARVPTGQAVPAGSYADAPAVTIFY